MFFLSKMVIFSSTFGSFDWPDSQGSTLRPPLYVSDFLSQGEGGGGPDRKQGHAMHQSFISKFVLRKDSIFCTLSAPLLVIRCCFFYFIYTSKRVHYLFVFEPSNFDAQSDGWGSLRRTVKSRETFPCCSSTVKL